LNGMTHHTPLTNIILLIYLPTSSAVSSALSIPKAVGLGAA
jgi:hypothetical protein